MKARTSTKADAEEIVRLAAMMFESMGIDTSGTAWRAAAGRHVAERLGRDLAIFVVDHPDVAGGLVAVAAGTIAQRLPTPFNPSGRSGYVQWVCTEPAFRGQGLARLAMTALVDWYDTHQVPAVELHATTVAEPLYRSMGFDDSGPRALRRRRWEGGP